MRFRPKGFAPPRSRAGREIADGGEPGGLLRAAEVLKDIWHGGYRRPRWARIAKKFGWMTDAAYYALRPTERDPSGDVMCMMYTESAFFRLLKKDSDWGRPRD